MDEPNIFVFSRSDARARGFAKKFNSDIAIIDKRRDRANECEVMNIIGDVKGKDIVMVDDIADTGGTLIKASIALKAQGANKIFIFISHPVFSYDIYERINDSIIDKLFITDTLITDKSRLGSKIEVLSVASIIANAIDYVHKGLSVSSIFDR